MEQGPLSNIDLNLLIVLDVLLEELHVTRSAKRLHRSQSAVSHALNRLRTQLDDPLLIRNGGRLQPSAMAQRRKPRLRQIISDLEYALVGNEEWDRSTCTRHFTLVGPDFTAIALPRILKTMRGQAPRATCELVSIGPDMFRDLALGRHDLVFFRNIDARTSVNQDPIGALEHVVFARAGHPALDDWGLDAWLAYPHIRIRMVGGPSPVSVGASESNLRRKSGPVVPSFLMTPPIIANTDALLTAPYGVLRSIINHHDIVVRPCPTSIDDIHLTLFSGTDLDPARRWFHSIAPDTLSRTFNHRFAPS